MATALALVLVGFVSVVRADVTVRTFMLESIAPVVRYGPFEFRQGVPVGTGADTFVLSCPGNSTVEFVQVESGRSFGPFDFVEGRVVLIGEAAYVLTGFGQKVVRDPEVLDEPAIRPLTAPAMSPSPEPVLQAIPAKPIDPTPARDPVIGVSDSDRRPPVPSPSDGRNEPLGETSVLHGLGPLRVEVGIGILDTEQYEWNLAGENRSYETSIDRTTVSLTAGGKALALSVGFVYKADVDGAISDSAGSVLNGEASDGTGWWIGLRSDWDVWKSRCWRIDVGASASHRMEDYALSYDSYVSTDVSVVITNTPSDTSGEGDPTEVTETVKLWQFIHVGDEMKLTESVVFGDVRAIYESPGSLRAYIGLRLLAYSKTDAEATLSGYRGDFDLDFERTGSVSAILGVSRNLGGLRWYADAVAGTDVRLTIGLTREF